MFGNSKGKKRVSLEDVLADKALEEDLLEIPLGEVVFRWVLVVAGLVTLILIFQFGYISIVDGEFYENRAFANMSEIRMRYAPRGIIADRFGEPLVYNEPTTRVSLSPVDFPRDPDERIEILQRVGGVLDVSAEEMNEKISERDWGQSDRVLLAQDITHDQVIELSTEEFPGIFIEQAFKRVQAEPYVFSHILGYTGLVNKGDLDENPDLTFDDEIGRDGIEAFYDALLRGKNGKEIFFRNSYGKVEERKFEEQPESGKMLETYIDKEFQEFVYRELRNTLRELGRDIGLVVAMNPQNGEVLSLVNVPSFYANDIASFLNSQNKPLFNRTVRGLYNPGSTIKPLVALGALSEGLISPDRQIYSKGYIEIPNPYFPEKPSRFLDWKPQGWVDVKSALARSSNVYFYEVGGGFENQKGLGIEGLRKWWKNFLLDQKTGIDLAHEEEGFLPSPEWKEDVKDDEWRVGDTYNVSIGQGDFLITPISLLNYINAVANGGTLYAPRILKSSYNEGGAAEENGPSVLTELGDMIRQALPYVQEGMRDAVRKEYGTARLLNNLPFDSAAKTGTAQIANNTRTNAFFVGYAPYENPEIAILVLIENAREGSLNTIPLARDILHWYYENRLSKER